VYQSKFGEKGNCFEACLASILEKKLNEIPTLGSDEGWLHKLADFLSPFGLFYVEIDPENEEQRKVIEAMYDGKIYHFINGISPRGGEHACVGLNGELVHDPHPNGGGLDKVNSWGFLGAML
jgi:hypothetical protein